MYVSSGPIFIRRRKIDFLWLILVSFDRLVGKCCWVCSVSRF